MKTSLTKEELKKEDVHNRNVSPWEQYKNLQKVEHAFRCFK